MDMHEAANRVTALAALKQFASAFDPSFCCEKQTTLRFVPAEGTGALAFMDTETRELAFRVREKSLSLHKERAVLDAHSGLPVATLRHALLDSSAYSVYARTETEESPETFQFEIEAGSRLRMEFHDLVADARSVLGCDLEPSTDPSFPGSTVTFWLVRGKDEVREDVARLRYAGAKSPDGKAPASPSRGGVLEVAKGVDLMMMVLICVAFDDHRRRKGSP